MFWSAAQSSYPRWNACPSAEKSPESDSEAPIVIGDEAADPVAEPKNATDRPMAAPMTATAATLLLNTVLSSRYDAIVAAETALGLQSFAGGHYNLASREVSTSNRRQVATAGATPPRAYARALGGTNSMICKRVGRAEWTAGRRRHDHARRG